MWSNKCQNVRKTFWVGHFLLTYIWPSWWLQGKPFYGVLLAWCVCISWMIFQANVFFAKTPFQSWGSIHKVLLYVLHKTEGPMSQLLGSAILLDFPYFKQILSGNWLTTQTWYPWRKTNQTITSLFKILSTAVTFQNWTQKNPSHKGVRKREVLGTFIFYFSNSKSCFR